MPVFESVSYQEDILHQDKRHIPSLASSVLRVWVLWPLVVLLFIKEPSSVPKLPNYFVRPSCGGESVHKETGPRQCCRGFHRLNRKVRCAIRREPKATFIQSHGSTHSATRTKDMRITVMSDFKWTVYCPAAGQNAKARPVILKPTDVHYPV